MAEVNFSNPLICADDAYQTADNLRVMLHFMGNATLSDALNDRDGRRGISLIMEMCTNAADYIAGRIHPSKKPKQ